MKWMHSLFFLMSCHSTLLYRTDCTLRLFWIPTSFAKFTDPTWNSRSACWNIKKQITNSWHFFFNYTVSSFNRWALAFAGVSLVQNYGTTLFDAIDSHSKFNGHILAISEAGGSLGSYCAIYIDKFSYRSRQFIYVLGSSFMGIICVLMGVYTKIWGAYLSYVVICTIYRTFSCLVSVQCGRLLSNGQFILLFSVNNFAGLLIETLLQAAVVCITSSCNVSFLENFGFIMILFWLRNESDENYHSLFILIYFLCHPRNT